MRCNLFQVMGISRGPVSSQNTHVNGLRQSHSSSSAHDSPTHVFNPRQLNQVYRSELSSLKQQIYIKSTQLLLWSTRRACWWSTFVSHHICWLPGLCSCLQFWLSCTSGASTSSASDATTTISTGSTTNTVPTARTYVPHRRNPISIV